MSEAVEGLLVVDKPPGMTSHDVVARVRRLAQTRRVGHAGTLDPLATGVLVVGIGRATRLLGHLSLHDKEYDATVRLGVTTTTDDADGDQVDVVDASQITDDQIEVELRRLTGAIAQVPSAVSAIKVDGQRAYARVRAGETVELAARPVTVTTLDVTGRDGARLDLHVECSTGTYVRALARDLGAALGVGAHLTALRRTRVGRFGLDVAHPLDDLAGPPGVTLPVLSLADAVRQSFATIDVTAEQARRIGFGQRVALELPRPGPVAVFGPDGAVIALVEPCDGTARVICGFA